MHKVISVASIARLDKTTLIWKISEMDKKKKKLLFIKVNIITIMT